MEITITRQKTVTTHGAGFKTNPEHSIAHEQKLVRVLGYGTPKRNGGGLVFFNTDDKNRPCLTAQAKADGWRIGEPPKPKPKPRKPPPPPDEPSADDEKDED